MRSNFSHCFRNLYAIIRDNSYHNSRPPSLWERHVDDVLSIVHKIYLQELPEHINNLHPQTQFTNEEENNSTLPFLDILAQRNHDKTISVKIYRKPTHTNKYLKYTSHNPTSAKQRITALFDRADNVVSNEKNKIEEKHHILAASAIQTNSSKEQSKSTTGEKNSQENAQKKSLSKPKHQPTLHPRSH